MTVIMQKPKSILELIGTCLIILSIQILTLIFTLTESNEMKMFGLIFVGLSSPLYGYVIYKYMVLRRFD